jgi:hypothetical protein
VHKYGIRPQWTATLAERDAQLAAQALAASKPSLPGTEIGPAPQVKSLWDRFKEFWIAGYQADNPEEWQEQQKLLLPPDVAAWAEETAPEPGGIVETAVSGMLTGVVYILLVIVGLFAAYLIFRPEPAAIVKELTEEAKK